MRWRIIVLFFGGLIVACSRNEARGVGTALHGFGYQQVPTGISVSTAEFEVSSGSAKVPIGEVRIQVIEAFVHGGDGVLLRDGERARLSSDEFRFSVWKVRGVEAELRGQADRDSWASDLALVFEICEDDLDRYRTFVQESSGLPLAVFLGNLPPVALAIEDLGPTSDLFLAREFTATNLQAVSSFLSSFLESPP